jgi:hypothetical protein
MSEDITRDFTPVDELPEAPEPPPRVRTRTTRRPAAGAAKTRPRERPRASKTQRKAPPPTEPSVADAIRGMLQLPAAGLIITGQRLQSVALVADGATILVHGPNVAIAIAELAENDPRIMALLEKALAFGPYGVLLAALFPMVAQLSVNHGGPLPLLEGFGAIQPEKIITAASLEIPVEVSPNGQVSPDGNPPEN